MPTMVPRRGPTHDRSTETLTRRPEFAAFVGTVAVYIFFVWSGWPNFTNAIATGGWLNFATELGIITLPVALVMIAGHLDLSVGSLLASGAMTYAILANHFELTDYLALPAGVLVGDVLRVPQRVHHHP